MAATAHGRDDVTPRGVGSSVGDAGEGIAAPADFPQRWQKIAPGESTVPQPVQVVFLRVAPQFAQKWPDPLVPQAGQTVSGEIGGVMAYNLSRP
jgi:hypothetical protein